jgi:hypothetical protein
MIIAIKGKKGSGKDSLTNTLLVEGFEQQRFADPLKAMLSTMLAMAGVPTLTIARMIDGDLKEVPTPFLAGKTPRHAMQTLGTEWRDTLSKDLWLDHLNERLKGRSGNYIVSDCRFKHEATWVRERGGVVVEVVRSTQGRTEEGAQHISEIEMEQIVPDIEVFNYGGLDDLKAISPYVKMAIIAGPGASISSIHLDANS